MKQICNGVRHENVDAGGYGITFNDSISIDKRILIEHGVVLFQRDDRKV